jgi:hypothetical protein
VSLQPIAHTLQILKVAWTLERLVLWGQHHCYLFTPELFLCDNGGQNTFSVIIRRNIDNTDTCSAWVVEAQNIYAIALSHESTPLIPLR